MITNLEYRCIKTKTSGHSIRIATRTTCGQSLSGPENVHISLTLRRPKATTTTILPSPKAREGSFSFDKHKIFLYKEDFDKFREGLEEVIAYMKENLLKDVPEHTYETWKASEDNKVDVDFEDL